MGTLNSVSVVILNLCFQSYGPIFDHIFVIVTMIITFTKEVLFSLVLFNLVAGLQKLNGFSQNSVER